MNLRENVRLASVLLLMLMCFIFPANAKCLAETAEVYPKRYFYYGEDTLDIKIEVSSRISHQLASHVLKILLEEVIGYANVSLVFKEDFMNTTLVLNRISGCHNRSNCKHHHILDHGSHLPESMINLEVWTGPGFNMEEWLTSTLIEDCGPLGPIGRFGWYIPKYMTSNNWKQCDVIDHWRALQEESIAKVFSLADEMDVIRKLTMKSENSFYCQDKSCHQGIFTPQICEHENSTCATLLSNYADITLDMIRDQIDLLKLKVEVAWIGPHLSKYVIQRFSQEKPVLFFNWKPNPLTASDNYTHIAFPMCEDLPISFPFPTNCEFEINQLEKIAWSELKTATPEAMRVVRAMLFTHNQYTALLNNYMNRNVGKSVYDVACSWVQGNKTIWSKWIPNDLSSKTTIYIGGIFPMSGINYSSKGIIPAASMAIESVNQNNSVLKDYRLEMLREDGRCSSDHVMKAYIKYVTIPEYTRIAGILGPACSDTVEPIAGVAKHFNSVIISYSAEGAIPFQDSDEFPLFFRTIPSNRLFKHVYLQLFLRLGWKRVAALTEDGQKYPEYLSLTQDFLQANGINFIANRKFPRERLFMNMSQSLEDLRKKKARIIIGDFYDYAARAVMCEAYKQGMTARNGYVWFLPMWFSKNWYDTDFYNNQSEQITRSKPVPCSTWEMIQAINGHLSLVYSYYGQDNDIMQEGITVGEWRKRYKKRVENEIHSEAVLGNKGTLQPGVRDKRHAEDEISDYAGYAYDAVWVYAYALDELLKQNHSYIATLHSEKTTKKYVDILNRTNFHGVSGHIRFMGPTRLSVINVLQWVNNHTSLVGRYIPLDFDEGRLELNESSVVWLTSDGQIAGDGSEKPESCALEALRQLLDVECEVAIVVANIFGFGLFALIMILCFIFFKRRYEQKVKLTEARMRELGLTSSTTMLTLDEWEIPKDRVVLNRKLGEGAFGTVYGGEAFFDEKGWVPVAVKTLKVGSTVEEKLDFLSEAEMMKRFDHKNIIQLLGVCTRGEAVYTVMEFMLYGDLKTYLLARRSMVNEKLCDESDEVSNKRLSSMALDVARGLSYLADLKYVHRDLACRNCLVNSSRTVKIGDFGMTRPMYDSDYYRFNKKGMLPVRWMAPESLADGIFTTMSDVWSFGVLLYEVITFGSFPFQGLSNNQVLEFVKSGNRLRVPTGCKQQLEWLLLTCWSRDPRDRPTASEIVEHLANNPRLVTPCLDVPLASVEMEGTGSLEFQLPERSRKFSTSITNKLVNSGRRRSGPMENTEMTIAHENTPMISGNGGPISAEPTKVTNLLPLHYVTLKEEPKVENLPKELCQNVTCL